MESTEDRGRKSKSPAVDYIRKWAYRGGKAQIALLGEYGSGKTTLCKRIAHDLASRYLQSKNKEGKRLPIIIPLREFPRGQADIEVFIVGHLARRCGVKNPNYESFKAMHDAGLLLLIFDGFDEMAIYVDEDTIYANLFQIEQLAASPNSKILLTSRPEYFKTSQEEEEALRPKGLIQRRSEYDRLYLQPLGEEQVKYFLENRIPYIPDVTEDWSYYYREIKRIHDLSDLSRRPVLLEMIVKTLPLLIAQGKPVDRPTLYQTYLETELQRQSIEKRRELLIKREDRLRMMQTLALHFYIDNPPGLSADLVQILVHDQLSQKQREELEAYTRDFLTCSFLTRQGDNYFFSHRSLVEYLSAKSLLEEVEEEKPQLFGKRQLTREVFDFLHELRPNQQTLFRWVQDTRYRGFDSVRYLGSNAITLLNMLGYDFRGVDLAGSILNGADLKNGNFENAIFAQADLSNVDFTNAILAQCKFSEATLTKTTLISADIRNSNFSGAYLDFTDLTGADISGSNFNGCICYQANCNDVIAETIITGFSLNGVRNPSPSIKILSTDITGQWTDKGKKRLLSIQKKDISHILGRLEIVGKTWIEFEGNFQKGKYSVEGAEFSIGYKITMQVLKDLKTKNVPDKIVNKIKEIKDVTFTRRETFLDSVRKLTVKEMAELRKSIGNDKASKFIDAVLESAEIMFRSSKCIGWLTTSAGHDEDLLLHLDGGTERNSPEQPWIFIRPPKIKEPRYQ